MATNVLAAGTIGLGFEQAPKRAPDQRTLDQRTLDQRTLDQRTLEQIAERNRSLLALEQRVRRGPTPEVLFVKHLDNTRLVKTEDPVRVREMRIFAAAMTALFLFLMAYGWQHFSAIEYGYHVEAEKQQREVLQEENRRLQMDEARLCDPGRINRMALELGLNSPQPGQVVDEGPGFDSSEPALAEASPVLPNLR